jgi:diguanylate cyclase (GGDEF)-like protein
LHPEGSVIHRPRFGLRWRLLLLVLVAVLPALGLILATAWEQRRLAAEGVGEEALRIARLASTTQDRLIEASRSLLVGLARLSDVQMHYARTCSAHFSEIGRQFPLYRDVGAIRPDGVVFCTARPTAGQGRPADPAAFARTRAARDFTASGYRPEPGGIPVLTLAYPAIDTEGRVWAAVFVDLDLRWVDQLVDNARLPAGSVVSVVDANGSTMRQYPDAPRSAGHSPPGWDRLEEAARGQAGEGMVNATGPDGVERLYAVTTLSSGALPGPAYVIVGIPKAVWQVAANRLLFRNLVVTVLVLLVALGATALTSDLFILRRLKAVVGAAERLTGGDLSARAEVRGQDEIAVMARTFNVMAERLTDRVGEVQAAKDALADRVRELNLLNRMGELLQASMTMDEAYRVIGALAAELFPRDTGAVFALSPSRTAIEAMASWGPRPMDDLVFAPDQCWALRNGQSHGVADAQSGVRCGHLPSPPPAAYVCTPLMAQGETLGVLYIGAPTAEGMGSQGSGDAKRRLIEAVAAQLALGLANVKLREVLRSQSIRDPLTGLFNRRYMEETLEREVRRAERAGRPLALLILDVDEFKQHNDRFGHDAGDAVLRELGILLGQSLRREDVACRYGGDEFVLVLPDASLETGRRRADEIQEAVRGLRLWHQGHLVGPITVSMGLAAMPDNGRNRDALLAAADAALYRAKHDGRDRASLPASREHPGDRPR